MHQMTNPDLHKGWKCFTVLADEQTKQCEPHAQLACLRPHVTVCKKPVYSIYIAMLETWL